MSSDAPAQLDRPQIERMKQSLRVPEKDVERHLQELSRAEQMEVSAFLHSTYNHLAHEGLDMTVAEVEILIYEMQSIVATRFAQLEVNDAATAPRDDAGQPTEVSATAQAGNVQTAAAQPKHRPGPGQRPSRGSARRDTDIEPISISTVCAVGLSKEELRTLQANMITYMRNLHTTQPEVCAQAIDDATIRNVLSLFVETLLAGSKAQLLNLISTYVKNPQSAKSLSMSSYNGLMPCFLAQLEQDVIYAKLLEQRKTLPAPDVLMKHLLSVQLARTYDHYVSLSLEDTAAAAPIEKETVSYIRVHFPHIRWNSAVLSFFARMFNQSGSEKEARALFQAMLAPCNGLYVLVQVFGPGVLLLLPQRVPYLRLLTLTRGRAIAQFFDTELPAFRALCTELEAAVLEPLKQLEPLGVTVVGNTRRKDIRESLSGLDAPEEEAPAPAPLEDRPDNAQTLGFDTEPDHGERREVGGPGPHDGSDDRDGEHEEEGGDGDDPEDKDYREGVEPVWTVDPPAEGEEEEEDEEEDEEEGLDGSSDESESAVATEGGEADSTV